MAQIVNNPPTLGASIGKGLSAGLQSLAEQKFAEMDRKAKHAEKATRLRALGLPGAEADYLAGLEDKFNYLGASNYFANRNQSEQQQPQAQSQQQEQPQGTLEQLVNAAPSVPGAAPSPEQLMLESLASGQPLTPIQALMKSLEMRNGQSQQMSAPQSTQQNANQQSNPMAPKGQNQASQQMQGQQQPETFKLPNESPYKQDSEQEIPGIFRNSGFEINGLKQASLNPAAAEKEARLTAKEERLVSQEARKFTKDYVKKAESAKANIRDYDLLIRQAESGKLRAGAKHQLLTKVGLGEFNQNFETQIANKLIARLAQNVGGAFGSGARITNFLEQTFQRSLPSLWNTPQGIVAISKMNKYASEAELLKSNASRDLLRENKGIVPFDADFQIDERTQDQVKALEDKALSAVMSSHFPPTKNYSKDYSMRFQGNKWRINNGDWELVEEGE